MIIISSIENKYDIEEIAEQFATEVNFFMLKNFKEYDDANALTVVMSVNDRKIGLRKGKNVKNFLKFEDQRWVVGEWRKDLRTGNYSNAVHNVLLNVQKSIENNIACNNSYLCRNKGKIIYRGIFYVIFLVIVVKVIKFIRRKFGVEKQEKVE